MKIKMKTIYLPSKLELSLKKYGNKHYPRECVTMITGKIKENNYYSEKIHYIKNIAQTTEFHYIPDHQKYYDILSKTKILDDKSDTDLVAIFHTHPRNLGIPSALDAKGASWRTIYLIYGMLDDKILAWYWNGTFFERALINNSEKK